MFKTLTKPPFSIKSLALNPHRIELRLINTWYTQQRKADQGHHNQLQQVFYNQPKSKQLLIFSTSPIVIRSTPQYFGTSTSLQTLSKKKMVNYNYICRVEKIFLLILSNRQQFDSLSG